MGDQAEAAVDEQPFEYDDEVPVPEPEPEPQKEEEEPAPKAVGVPDAKKGGAPPWVHMPEGLKIPRHRQVIFMRFPSAWTQTPNVGRELRVDDEWSIIAAGKAGALWRQVICWNNSIGDEKLAVGRAMGDRNRLMTELVRQWIRAVDGEAVDWTGERTGPMNLDVSYEQFGGPVRNMLERVFGQVHTLDVGKQKLFFEHCIEVRTAG